MGVMTGYDAALERRRVPTALPGGRRVPAPPSPPGEVS